MQEVQNFLRAAIECSYFVCPREPGLTYQELHEIAQRAGYLRGEVDDALSNIRSPIGQNRRILLEESALRQWVFLFKEEPDYRNFDAFDFVIKELNQRVREDGFARAQIERDLLVERAIADGIPGNDVEIAVTYMVGANLVSLSGNHIRYPGTAGSVRPLPSQNIHTVGGRAQPKPDRAKAYPMVQDVIERRSDGRSLNVEPLEAFAHQLGRLGYAPFRLWWKQTVTEMRLGDPAQVPTSVTVLAAALVEAALTFVVKHARSLDLPVFKSADFDRSPQTWKVDDLANSAASGGSEAILDPSTKALVQTLIRNRQRIHAGRMLVDHPLGVPDFKSDEARQAKATAEQVVRRVLDWLERHPPD